MICTAAFWTWMLHLILTTDFVIATGVHSTVLFVFVEVEDTKGTEIFHRHAHLKTSFSFSSNDAIKHTPLRWTIPLQIEQK